MLATVEEHHPSDRLRRARAALLEAGGDLDGAERVYAEDVQAFPRNIERQLIWTRCLMRLGRQSEAIVAVSEGLKQTPKSADLLPRQTLLFLQATRFAEAGASLVLLQKYHPGHVQLPQFRARSAEASGDLERAESVLAADAASHPHDAMRRVRWVNCLRRWGQIAKAMEILAGQPSPAGTERKLHIGICWKGPMGPAQEPWMRGRTRPPRRTADKVAAAHAAGDPPVRSQPPWSPARTYSALAPDDIPAAWVCPRGGGTVSA